MSVRENLLQKERMLRQHHSGKPGCLNKTYQSQVFATAQPKSPSRPLLYDK